MPIPAEVACVLAKAKMTLAYSRVLLGEASSWHLKLEQAAAVKLMLAAGCDNEDIASVLAGVDAQESALVEHEARTEFAYETLAERYHWQQLPVEKLQMLQRLLRCAHTAVAGAKLEDKIRKRQGLSDRRFREFVIALANVYSIAFGKQATVTSGVGSKDGAYTGGFYNFTLECAPLLLGTEKKLHAWRPPREDWGQVVRNALRESATGRPEKLSKRRGRPPKS